MLIRNKKMFSIGSFLATTFLGVLLLIFSPVFNGKNGLQFADDSFNRLSKGSSYFIPKVSKSVEKVIGKQLSQVITFDKADDAQTAAKLFSTAGAKTEAQETKVSLEGDLAAILKSTVADADAMFKNDGKVVADKYGMDEKKAMKSWWMALGKIEKNMKKEKQIEEAKVVSEVNKKAVEPAYNFYKIEGEKVADHAGMLSGLLIFYVAYTMWWGYSIFYLFDAFGLSMKKAKVKKEA
ncbi:MAG: hypothetical protein HZB62_06260 [Nitrospirae bacterium]|nr:hypothetical protein [Nitrospirota bacterium]